MKTKLIHLSVLFSLGIFLVEFTPAISFSQGGTLNAESRAVAELAWLNHRMLIFCMAYNQLQKVRQEDVRYFNSAKKIQEDLLNQIKKQGRDPETDADWQILSNHWKELNRIESDKAEGWKIFEAGFINFFMCENEEIAKIHERLKKFHLAERQI